MAPFKKYRLWRLFCVISLMVAPCHGAMICYQPHCGLKGLEGWAFEVGVAAITNNDIGEILSATAEKANGKSEGEIYSVTASRRIGELHWTIGGHTFTPQVELPMTLEIVNEHQLDTFLDYNASFAIRWVDFPWNDAIKTSFMMGLGLSYSDRIYQVDRERHPGEDRSNLKFNWPIQLTFANPESPQDHLTVFIAHQSGGHVFDEGGVNSIGVGFRHEF